MAELPLIVDIKRYSFDDGPGIRSVVFFKGCPLACVFCHNPETHHPYTEIAFVQNHCIKCGACGQVCPKGAIDFGFSGRVLREKCDGCGRCVDVCPGKGLRRVGEYFTVESLIEILLRDSAYYRTSGGGVTLSGGECTMFPDYLESLLIGLKAAGIHVLLETSGYFNYDTFGTQILPHLDLIYYDFKLADGRTHKKFTGQPNDLILSNFQRLIRESGIEIQPRIPLVPGITTTEENLSALVSYLYGAGADQVLLLPYNPTGLDKYASLGMLRPDLPEAFMKPEEERKVREILESLRASIKNRKQRP